MAAEWIFETWRQKCALKQSSHMDPRRESVALFRQVDDAEKLDDVPLEYSENTIELSGVRPAVKSPARSVLRDIFKSVHGDQQKRSPSEQQRRKRGSVETSENAYLPKKALEFVETPNPESRPSKIPTFRSPRTALQNLTSPTRPQPKAQIPTSSTVLPTAVVPAAVTPSASGPVTRSTKQQTTPIQKAMPPPAARPTPLSHTATITPVRKTSAPPAISSSAAVPVLTPSAVMLQSPATKAATTPKSALTSPLSAPSSVVTSVETLPPRTRAQMKKATAAASPTRTKNVIDHSSPAMSAYSLQEWEQKIDEAIRLGSPIGRVYVRSSPPGSDKKP